MEILPYDSAMLPELTSAYNRAVADVPHCYPVRSEKLGASLAGAPEDHEKEHRLHSEAVVVAREGASTVGFVHAGVGRFGEQDNAEQGVIRFLCYEKGRRKAGQALLGAAEERFREHGATRVQAFPQEHHYPFYYLGPAYLSDRMGHVQALLLFNGYRRMRGEVFLDRPDFEPVEPTPLDVDAEIAVEWKDGPGKLPDGTVRAFREKKEIGVCECSSCGECSDADEAQDWFMVHWLGVAKEVQGKGLGRHLLQRALREMRGAGYRHAAISTAWDNYRAFLFYSNFGFRVVDWTYGFGRELGTASR